MEREGWTYVSPGEKTLLLHQLIIIISFLLFSADSTTIISFFPSIMVYHTTSKLVLVFLLILHTLVSATSLIPESLQSHHAGQSFPQSFIPLELLSIGLRGKGPKMVY
jgi:hypothetical protein